MTMSDTAIPTLSLTLGLDRSLAWAEGGSVRYLVADLAASGTARRAESAPLNLALAIDVSGSMQGDKIEAARKTAAAVAAVLTARDRLTVVAFADTAELLLDARNMDGVGREAAAAAICRLAVRGNTNLWEGWLLAAERAAVAMQRDPAASHRLLLLSDGHANTGLCSRSELARHAGELQARGIVTSAVGIGDGYDEELLAAMTETGGGRLHDAERSQEIEEVVLGDLLEGRATLIERASLRIALPAELRAEIVGDWAHRVVPGALEITVGALLPEASRRIVVRLHCRAGAAGVKFSLGASASGFLPDGSAEVETQAAGVDLRLTRGRDNNAQPRDIARSVAVVTAWQAQAMRRATVLNRDGERRGARHFLERELRWMEPYARGLPGVETTLRELVLLLRRIEEELDPRLRKEIMQFSKIRSRNESDLRSVSRPSLSARLDDGPWQ